MSSDEFLEFDDDAQSQESSSGRNPFVVLAGVLVTVLILASICTVYLISQRNQGTGQEAAAIEATNAVIAVTNTAVAETVAAMETESAQPATETPTPSPAVTAVPSETPTTPATETPTVAPDETDTPEGNGDVEEPVGTITATVVVSDGITPTAAFDTAGTDDTLPQTGLDTWVAALLAVFFIGLFVTARRLRGG